MSQSLIGVQVRLAALLNQIDAADPIAPKLSELMAILRHTTEDLQGICAGLRPSILDDLGLLPTLAWLCREARAIAPELDLVLELTAAEGEIPTDIKISIYRIAQEGLANVFKHAGAKRAVVRLARSEQAIVLEIRDDGSGFDPQKAGPAEAGSDPRHGFGLTSMRQRAALSGGIFLLESAPGSGTTIRVTWPPAGVS